MRKEIRLEIQRMIAESFDKARGPEPQKRAISEEQRQAQTKVYADLLIKAALRNLRA